MTAQEAYKILHPDTSRDAIWKVEYYAGFNGKEAGVKAVEDACIVACEALKKQIPKKPVFKEAVDECDTDNWVCPECGEIVKIFRIREKYCDNCGQKIDWSEQNE